MNKILLLLTGVLSSWLLSAQTLNPPDLNKSLIAPSPEAASLGKYGIFPVTLYTGLPSVSIPVFELKTSSLSLPISLSYNYNGYKPAEDASWVGLGWSLQAGGVITRIIKHKIDGSTANKWADYASITEQTPLFAFMANVAIGNMDTEPDIYAFNFNGHSGKFIMVGNKAFLFPHQDLMIRRYGEGFAITDENGDTYQFVDLETTTPNNSQTPGTYTPAHISAWQLSKIISADYTDTIHFSYSTFSHRQYASNYSETFTQKRGTMSLTTSCLSGGASCDVWTVSSGAGPMLQAQRITTITSKAAVINFIVEDSVRKDLGDTTGGYALKEISIWSQGPTALVKKFKLKHDYFGGVTSPQKTGHF